jgi:outer membrane autotransporter protein
VTAGVNGAYDLRIARHLVLSPEVGIDYAHLDVDHVSEAGAGVFDLDVAEREADSLRSHAGGRLGTSFNCGPVFIMAEANAAWYHEFLDGSSGVATSLPGAPTLGTFVVRKEAPERDFALAGVGVSVIPRDCRNVAVFLDYNAQVGQDDFTAHSVDGGARVEF